MWLHRNNKKFRVFNKEIMKVEMNSDAGLIIANFKDYLMTIKAEIEAVEENWKDVEDDCDEVVKKENNRRILFDN